MRASSCTNLRDARLVEDRFNAGDIMMRMRERAGLDRYEMADKMGVTYGHIWKWESGKTCPSVYNFVRFARAAGYEIKIRPKEGDNA